MLDLDLSLPLPRDLARASTLALLDSPDPLFDAFDGEQPRRPGRFARPRPPAAAPAHLDRDRALARSQSGIARALSILTLLAATALLGPSCGRDEGAPASAEAILVQLHDGARLPDWTHVDEQGPLLIPLEPLGPDDEAPLLRLPVPPGRAARELATELEGDAAVAFAEPIVRAQPLSRTPDDPRFKDLWGLAEINAPAAWATSVGDRAVTVAVIDDGLALDHPDLAANLWTNPGELAGNGVDDDGDGIVDDVHGALFLNGAASGDPAPDPSGSAPWHGTHAAGIIGAVGDNRTGVVGVNWRVSLMGVRALGEGGGRSDDLARAIDFASSHGARVINASWGGSASAAVAQAIARAGRRGALFVAAAGNDGALAPGFPADLSLDNLLSVGALDVDGALAPFSNRGALVAAPGVAILSTSAPGSYERADGTSVAAPFVAGLAALLFAAHPQASAAQVREAILSSAHAVAGVARGRIDAAGAMAALERLGDRPDALVLSREALTFQGGGMPRAQVISLRSASGAALAVTARSSAPWVDTVHRDYTTPARVTVWVDPRRLPPGEQSGRIIFSGPRGESVALEVTLHPGAGSGATALGAGCSTAADGAIAIERGALCALLAPGLAPESDGAGAPDAAWLLPDGTLSRGARLTALFPKHGAARLRARLDGQWSEVAVRVE